MPTWFDYPIPEHPGPEDLRLFVLQVQHFLRFVLEDHQEFRFLWEDEPALRILALETFEQDVSEGVASLTQAIPEANPNRLASHGLLGRPLNFKLKVLASISRGWEGVKGHFTVRGWFKQMCDAIDAILDSLIQAAGAGGIIKEFKDALSALAKTT